MAKLNEMTQQKDGALIVKLQPEADEWLQVRVTIGGKEIKGITSVKFEQNSAEKVKAHLNKVLKK